VVFWQDLEIRRGVVSFVGAGGKTSMMLAMAKYLREEGEKVVVTTTTKMAVDDFSSSALFEPVLWGASIQEILRKEKIPFVHKAMEGGKYIGIDGREARSLQAHADFVLVEADGASGKSIKHPRPHEPVIPGGSGQVFLLIGLDSLKQPFDEEHCFNLQGINAVLDAGQNEMEVLDSSVIRKILFSEGGYMEHSRPDLIFHLVLNKTDVLSRDEAEGAARSLFHPFFHSIFISKFKGKPEICRIDNASHSVCGIVLAAGESKRFGQGNKLLEPLAAKEGKCSLELVLDSCLKSHLDNVVLVMGHDEETVRSLVEKEYASQDLFLAVNPDFAEGMSTSLKMGLASALKASNFDAVMFILADQPGADSRLLDDILEAYKNSAASLCAPFFGDRRGNPVVVGKRFFNNILTLEGDVGAREIICQNDDWLRKVSVEDEAVFKDLDTPGDFDFTS